MKTIIKNQMPTEFGITETARAVANMGESQYRLAEGLNKSLLVHFLRSPLHYKAALEEKKEPTESMKMGTALHAEILLNAPSEAYAVMKKVDGRTNEGKAYKAKFEDENKGKTVINEEQAETVLGMKNSLYSHPSANKLLQGMTHKELAVFGRRKCQHGELLLKGMLDGYDQNTGLIIDLKTAENASPDKFSGFPRACKNFRYDLQAVHYSWLIANAGLPFSGFRFIVVENKKPFAVAVYEIGMDSHIAATNEWMLALDQFSFFKEKNDFNHGYPDTVMTIDI